MSPFTGVAGPGGLGFIVPYVGVGLHGDACDGAVCEPWFG